MELNFCKEPAHLFYSNLCIFKDIGELKTLDMGNHIIVNKDVFGTNLFGTIPYMNSIWHEDFEVTLKVAKEAVLEPVLISWILALYLLAFGIAFWPT